MGARKPVKETTPKASRVTELRYRRLFESARAGLLILDAGTGVVVDVNPFLLELLGSSRKVFLGKQLWALGCFKHLVANAAQFAELLTKDYCRYEELPLETADGRRITVEFISNVYRANQHKLVQFNITEHKRAAEAQARLALAIEQVTETIVIADLQGTIIYVNPAFEKMTGYARQEALGQNARLLKSGKQDAEFYRKMWTTLTAGQVWSGHFINKRKDGSLYEEEATIAPVRDAAGQIVCYVAVKRDVTRAVALEVQQRQAAKMETIGRLAGGMAHDFNNKLQIIMGCVEMLLQDLPPGHPFHVYLQDIQEAARRAADLTRQLLTFSRQQAIVPVVLDVNAAIDGQLQMLGSLVGDKIHLRFVPQPDLGPVFMDPLQLEQILANLAANARDAIASTGHISIETAQRTLQAADGQAQPDGLPPGNYVVLTFRDDGAGMSPEVQAHLFEPFFTTKEEGKGTGLGLATVYGIVKQNHGAITVHSAPGQGTTFTLYLPRLSGATRARPEIAGLRPAGKGTILLVEDENDVLNLVQQTLTHSGYTVLTAGTPDMALEVSAQYPEPIHLLLTDVLMPGMDGKALAERILKLRPGIRVLYMSGYPAGSLAQHGHLPAGPRVLQKPFTSSALTQHVRAALEAPTTPPAGKLTAGS